ncbi:MAG: hypothetical protein K2O46_07915, partial [Bacteroidales bacterium]|nr:hypothetical protein [Bacteroidales bacterium]
SMDAKRRMIYGGFRRMGMACLLGGLLFSCHRPGAGTGGTVAVRVADAILYKEDIEARIPKGTLSQDSAHIAEKIINDWTLQQVMLKKAKENAVSAAAFEKQIEEYKNSLILYDYQNRVLSQRLDTAVSAEEIAAYYQQNMSQFYLKSNIVRVRFVKLRKDHRLADKIKKAVFTAALSDEDMLQLAKWCRQAADNYYLEEDQWLYFNDLLREVPIQTYNQEDFLKNNRNIEISAGDAVYYVRIVDFKVRDMVSPLNFETERIRQILLNHRRQVFLQTMQQDLMREAEENHWIKYE